MAQGETVSRIEIFRRGYFWCSPSCVCKNCLLADDWTLILDTNPWFKVYRDPAGNNTGPSEFRTEA